MIPRNLTRLANKSYSVLLAALLLAGCEQVREVPPVSPAEAMPGGAATVLTQAIASFDSPVANLPEALKPSFYAGKALAEQPWVKAPTATTARDGLGPLYNARACMACHIRGGRGRVPESPQELLTQGVLRVSIPEPQQYSKELGVAPHPLLGDQLQTQSVALSHQLRHVSLKPNKREVQPEAYVNLRWQNGSVRFSDGEVLALRKPILIIDQTSTAFDEVNLLTSLRSAPAILGAGLIEAIAYRDIAALVDPDDRDGDGISGRVNWVWDPLTESDQPGRFGWKASRANVAVTVAAAFANDLGISNPIFSQQPCTALQPTCMNATHGNDASGVELPQDLLDLVVFFTQNLNVVSRARASSPEIKHGRRQFYLAGCDACHQPSYITGEHPLPHLSKQTIWPYSDFLLHDMGEGLADNRSDFSATGHEWRTPPLWGIGLSAQVNGVANLLHDGRARSVAEAIVWHGGEAKPARQKFIQLTKKDREALIAFVESL